VRDGNGALYCFAESNLNKEIAFCKAIKAGGDSPTRPFWEGDAQIIIRLSIEKQIFKVLPNRQFQTLSRFASLREKKINRKIKRTT
jgi:hypothetical protein